MSAIEQICLTEGWRVESLWPDVARHCQRWLAGRGLVARDAVVLLPFAALLPPARLAFAALGGWQPRVETPLTLAAALGPPRPPLGGQCSGDPVLDRLACTGLLHQQSWGAAWAARDAAGFARIVGLVVEAAQALRDAAAARSPALRDAFWAECRAALPVAQGPAGTEALLLRLALEWAAASPPAATDALFAHRPAAWLALRLGGMDPLVEGLLASAEVPTLRIVADPEPLQPYAGIAAALQLERRWCEDFEGEAQAAAAVVVQALNARQVPVALVALDRELVRRVRALLERQHVPLVDETGWLLATTRAAAEVVALLRAALPGAGRDALLEWLKAWPPASPVALDSLEAWWRGRRRVPDRPAAEALLAQARQHLQPLSASPAQTLGGWVALLAERLAADGSLQRLGDDAAGVQTLAALHLQSAPDEAWRQASSGWRMDLPGFVAWVVSTLELAPFLPPPDPGAEVVLTPLARAFGRPFGQVVIPGADHQHLGVTPSRPALAGDALAAAWGLEHAALRRQRQRQAFVHTLRAPRITLLRRHRDGDEPLAESPEVDWLLLAREQAGLPVWPLQPWQPELMAVPVAPQARPQPTAAACLPDTLSASQLEALRACPYRFFARAVLRLDEAEELEAGLDKRDYGTWLHAVLHHFHAARQPGDAAAALQEAATAVTRASDLDEADLLPYRTSFEVFAPAYLDWVAAREAQGWFWADGESDHVIAPPELAGLSLRGRIDRLDRGPGACRQLLDYKTSSVASLRQRVREPLEDTQLAFYAALLGADEKLGAAYLALDDAHAPVPIEHADVQRSAAALLTGLGGEWQRLRAGAALPALGEGAVCDTCEARGLCRRDHWSGP
jgi:ATP-dependent helicase/nuclease subunit B